MDNLTREENKAATLVYSIIIILITIFLFSGCSASWHLKKAVKKDPSLITNTVIDTTFYDTLYLDKLIIVPYGTDSTVEIEYLINTIDSITTIFNTERTKVRLYRDENKKLKLSLKEQSFIVPNKDSIVYVEIPAQINCPPQIIQEITNFDKFMILCGYVFWVFVAGIILIFVTKKISK